MNPLSATTPVSLGFGDRLYAATPRRQPGRAEAGGSREPPPV